MVPKKGDGKGGQRTSERYAAAVQTCASNPDLCLGAVFWQKMTGKQFRDASFRRSDMTKSLDREIFQKCVPVESVFPNKTYVVITHCVRHTCMQAAHSRTSQVGAPQTEETEVASSSGPMSASKGNCRSMTVHQLGTRL